MTVTGQDLAALIAGKIADEIVAAMLHEEVQADAARTAEDAPGLAGNVVMVDLSDGRAAEITIEIREGS